MVAQDDILLTWQPVSEFGSILIEPSLTSKEEVPKMYYRIIPLDRLFPMLDHDRLMVIGTLAEFDDIGVVKMGVGYDIEWELRR